MAITFTNLETSSDAVDRTSYTSGSVTPTTSRLILVTACGVATGEVNPTVSGLGITWGSAVHAGGSSTAVPARVVETFYGTSNGGVGSVVVSWGTMTQARCFWSTTEVNGVPFTNNGADAIIQTAGSVRLNGGGSITS